MQTQGHTKYVCIYSSCAINLYKTNLFLFVPKLIQYGIFPFMQKYVYKYKTNIRPTYLSIYPFFYLFIYLYICPWPAAKFAGNKKDKGGYSESYFWARQRNWLLRLPMPMPCHNNMNLEKKPKMYFDTFDSISYVYLFRIKFKESKSLSKHYAFIRGNYK